MVALFKENEGFRQTRGLIQFTARLLKSVDQRQSDDIFLVGTQHLDLNDEQVKDEIERIDGHNTLLVVDPKVKIYFPSFEYFYMKTYRDKKGFTLGKIIELICKTGYNAMKNRFHGYPETFVDVNTAEEAGSTVSEYGLVKFHQLDNSIYVNVDM